MQLLRFPLSYKTGAPLAKSLAPPTLVVIFGSVVIFNLKEHISSMTFILYKQIYSLIIMQETSKIFHFKSLFNIKQYPNWYLYSTHSSDGKCPAISRLHTAETLDDQHNF